MKKPQNNKVDGILEGPKKRQNSDKSAERLKPAPAAEGKFLSEICDDCCLACPAFVEHGGNCYGAEHMNDYDLAEEAMKNIGLYFEQYVDSLRLNGALALAAEAVRALNPMLRSVEYARLSEAQAAVGLLRAQVEDDASSARATDELRAIIEARLEDLATVEELLSGECSR